MSPSVSNNVQCKHVASARCRDAIQHTAPAGQFAPHECRHLDRERFHQRQFDFVDDDDGQLLAAAIDPLWFDMSGVLFPVASPPSAPTMGVQAAPVTITKSKAITLAIANQVFVACFFTLQFFSF
jgi:hypothetical protein